MNGLLPNGPLGFGLAGRVGLLGLGAASIFLSACSGHRIHRDLYEDKRVMVRGWTQTTRPFGDAGDRGSEYSNPVIFESKTVAKTLIFGNRAFGLQALYPTLNQKRWSVPIEGGVVSELTVDRGTVYFGGGDGFLYAVDLETGRVVWKYEIRNPTVSRPTVDKGRVFVTTSDDTVYAFDAGTGKWLWHYRRRSASAATVHGASQPLVDAGEVITGLSDGFVVALSVDDGQLKWEKKLHNGSKFTDVDASPVLEDGILYLPSYDGSLYALKRKGGDVLWRFDAGGSKDIVIQGDTLYLPSSDGYVYALSKASSKVLWKFELDHGAPTRLVVTDRQVIFGSSYQYLYVVDKASGQGTYRYNAGWESGFGGSPAYDQASRRLYILSHSGNLFSFKVRDPGSLRARRHGSTDGFADAVF